MEKFATENLILLEFLVDQINMDYEIQKELSSIMGETCVSFQFLDNAPLHICEQDFSNNKQQLGTDQNVKSGKSCLFSLTPQQALDCSTTFDIVVQIFKKMAKGVLPDQIPIGTSLISIVNLFKELVDSINNSGETPAAKTLKDCFKITNAKGDNVGHISVYIRMSCFGKLIVTQFQMNLEDKSVQFKAKEGHYLFKYNKGKGGGGGGAPGGRLNPCEEWQRKMQPLNPSCPQVSCEEALMKLQQAQSGPPQQPQQPLPAASSTQVPDKQSCPVRPDCPGDKWTNQPLVPPNQSCPLQPCIFQPSIPQMPVGMQPGVLQQPFPQQGFPQQGFPQSFPIGPQGGQQSPPCAFPPEQVQQSANPCAIPNMPMMPLMPQLLPYGQQGGFPQSGFAQSGYPQMAYPARNEPPCKECSQPQAPPDPKAAYQEIGASMGGNAITIRVHKDKAKVEEVTDSDVTESDSRSCYCMDGYGKRKKKQKATESAQYTPPCLPSNVQQPSAMRPGVPDLTGPFNLKMGGCGAAANNNVVVSPPTCTAKDGTLYTELADPKKEVFVLRIGKKSEGLDKKNNLELELCTPKGPDIKPTPKKETRDTQCDEADLKCVDNNKNGKNHKHKGGKGKGKGGGKKGGKKKK